MNKLLTVFTSTYNRAYCLHQVYDSLCRQSCHDFIWLVIDDGSTDETKSRIESWQLEEKIDIQYHYKKNGGMHTGHNTAYELIDTPFNVCIDSDDYMPDNAVALILREINKLENKYSGIIGLDANKYGEIIGTKIPAYIKECKLQDLYTKYKVLGDKKMVYRTDLVKKYPAYPEFDGEKFVPLDYKYLLIDQDYNLKPVNEVLCIVEYQQDGSTMNIFKQYRKNPKGFAFSRISRINYGTTFKERFKNAIHLISSLLFINDFDMLKQNRNKSLVFLALPFGVLLNLYIRFKTRK